LLETTEGHVEFQWDPAKAQSNLQKHGIAFEDVIQIFYDPLTLREQDRHVAGEERWQAIGVISRYTIVVVAHATWDNEQGTEVIRIISAREAEPYERRRYEAG
jgi:uncharacterized DUF497 family protein